MTDKGIELIKYFEGCKLEAYKCPAGKWTIGIGATYYTDGTPVKQGDKLKSVTVLSQAKLTPIKETP